MREVHLTGQLVCHNHNEAELVIEHLPAHVALTTAEPGCLHFAVDRTSDPLIWHVDERFADPTAFDDHQRRVAASAWGRATAGIERRYSIDGLAD